MKKFCADVQKIAIALFVPFVIAGCIVPTFWYAVLGSVLIAFVAAMAEPEKETVRQPVKLNFNRHMPKKAA